MIIRFVKIGSFTLSLLGMLSIVSQPTNAIEQVFRSNIATLNAAFDQGGPLPTGDATLTLNIDNVTGTGAARTGIATLRVQIDVTGLNDLSSLTDSNGQPVAATHVAHIHGQFNSNDGVPATMQINGSFFTGEGGGEDVKQSVVPSVSTDDANSNGFLNFFEGLPSYGPVVLNLSSLQVPPAPSGTGPLVAGIEAVLDSSNGIGLLDAFPNNGTTYTLDQTYQFDLSMENDRRQFNNLMPLSAREIVIHGLTVPDAISDPLNTATMGLAIPADVQGVLLGKDVGGGMQLRTTAPAAAGSIQLVPEPSSIILVLGSLVGCTLLSHRRRCS